MRDDEVSDVRGRASRRRALNWFLGTTFGALCASIVYPLARYVSPPDVPEAVTHQVEAGSTNDAELRERGFKIVAFGGTPVILLRISESVFRAFAATCTHLDCVVELAKDRQLIVCNCHGGHYDLNGKNVGGPPPRPLASYSVHVLTTSGGQPGTIVVTKA